MFKTRLLSGIMLMIIALTTVIAGGQVLFTVLFAISLIGMSELYKVFGIEKKAPGIVGYIFAFGYYALIYMEEYLQGEKHTWFMLLFMAYLICQMAVLVFSYPKYNTQQIMAAFFGVFYVAVMLSYIYLTRMLPGGVFNTGDMKINYDQRKVYIGEQEMKLTQTEYNILALFSEHAGKVLTYAFIIRTIWGTTDSGSVKKLQVNMANIRKKLGLKPGDNKYFSNELGVGYRMNDTNE